MKKQNVRTLSFIVSTFTYLLVGAAIFDALESQTEETTLDDLEKAERTFKREYNISNDEYKSLEDIVIKYHPYRTFPQWKFTGAFYFSLTVITTIGYGHSTPQTILGKIFCMVYAIIGIPLCLVMFQSVGERLNYFASFCLQTVKKCFRLRNPDVNQTELVFIGGVLAIAVITGGASMFSHYEGWTYFDSIYYCVITLTTIGFGDFVALQDKNDLSNTSYVILSFTFILFGLTVVASSMNLLVLKFLTMNTDDERREFTREVQRNRSLRFSSADLLNIVNGNTLCELEPEDLEDLRKENSFILCFPSRTSLGTYIQNKFGSWSWCSKKAPPSVTDSESKKGSVFNQELVVLNHTSSAPAELSSANNINMITSCDAKEVVYDQKNVELAKYLQNSMGQAPAETRRSLKALVCPSCLSKPKPGLKLNNMHTSNSTNSKSAPIELDNNLFSIKSSSGLKKKSHYTIVRAPGEISHLLRGKLAGKSSSTEPENCTSPAPVDETSSKPKEGKKLSTVSGTAVKATSSKKSESDSDDKSGTAAPIEVSVFIDEDTEQESTVLTAPHLSPKVARVERRSSKPPAVMPSPDTSLKLAKNRRPTMDRCTDKAPEHESLLGVKDKCPSPKVVSSAAIDPVSLPNDTELIIEDDEEEEDLSNYKIVEV